MDLNKNGWLKILLTAVLGILFGGATTLIALGESKNQIATNTANIDKLVYGIDKLRESIADLRVTVAEHNHHGGKE